MRNDLKVRADERAGRREWLALAVLALPALLLALDLSVVNLALPVLSDDLGASSVEQLWITDIYGFLVAGFLITMGRLGDRIGRRRLLLSGAAVFAAASVLAAFSGTTWMLIAARALMGVAGATLAPSTLALIAILFRDPRQRSVGIAVYVSCFMGGAALGPVVGGILLEWFWWGAVFLLGVPVMAVLLMAGPILLPEFRDEKAGSVDLVSVALSLLTILPVVYGIKTMAQTGLGPGPVLVVVAGVVLGVLFVRRQGRLADPLLDLALFHNRAFSAALVILMCAVATQGGVMVLVGLHMQIVQGLTPLVAGLWGISPALGMVAGSLIPPIVARRIEPGAVIAGGLGLASVGYLLMTQVPTDGLALLVTSATVVFFGIGFVGALANDLVVGSAEPAKAGSAAALAQTSGDLGISLGIAVLGSVGTGFYAAQLTGDALPDRIPTEALQAARSSITDAATTAEALPGTLGADLFEAARVAFTSGLHVAAATSAALMAVMCVVAAWTLRRRQPTTAEKQPLQRT